MGVGDVDGIVEMDETFVAESFKCNHKKSGFKMPRPARKRGKFVIIYANTDNRFELYINNLV